MAIYKLFDINTATTPKPWGPKEEQAWKDIIDTVVVDTIDGTKNVGGHLHGKVYASDSVAAIDAQSTTSLVLNLRDDIATGLIIKNRNDDNIVTVNSSTATPAVSFNCDLDINGNIALDTYYLNYDGSDSHGISFNASNQILLNDDVGLGIAPTEKLTVDSGNVLINTLGNGILLVNSNNGVLRTSADGFLLKSSASINLIIDSDDNGTTESFSIRHDGADLASSDVLLHINDAGDIGIGTEDPIGKLHVYTGSSGVSSTYYTTGLFVENSSTAAISVINPDGNSGNIVFGSPSQTLNARIQAFYNSGSPYLAFFTNGNNQRMTIDSDGNVGIGEVSPFAPLHIVKSDTGTTSADAYADDFVVENNSYAGMSILGPDNVFAQYVFGSPSNSRGAQVRWRYSSLDMIVGTNVTDATLSFQTDAAASQMMIDQNGYVYMYNIQSSAGDADMRYNTSTGEVTYDTSAARYKKNIRENPDTTWLYQIPVVIYDRINGQKSDEIGIIADELLKLKPEYCSFNKNGEVESYNKSDLVPVLIAEIQKHEQRLKQLELLHIAKG